MIQQKYTDIVADHMLDDAIRNNEFKGFKEDYEVLHCLIRLHAPTSFFEVGTNHGTGTKIIKNAIGPDANVFTLDLPTSQVHQSLLKQPGIGGDNVGINCDLPFIQLRGDSKMFDYKTCKCDGYFIDGEHDYDHVTVETLGILRCNPKIIIYHDADIAGVYNAIVDAFKTSGTNYTLYRVNGTRIAYALKN